MPLEVDHVFIGCAHGAPEGDALIECGLREGSCNTHPGQGTANRRFFFRNSFLELPYVANEAEALSDQVRRTRLWERCEWRRSGACPFAIIFRPHGGATVPAPFDTWRYHTEYLPPGAAFEFAAGTPLSEPELIYMPFAHRAGPPDHEPTQHELPIERLCKVTVGLPAATLSRAAQIAMAEGLVTYRHEREFLLELGFTAAQDFLRDLRPTLPLILRGHTVSAR